MEYFLHKQAVGSMQAVKDRLAAALKAEGFGILTEIDVRETLKRKLDVNFRPYQILGACNPTFAYQALQAHSNMGVLLPCNVVIQENEPGKVDVSTINPLAQMNHIGDAELLGMAHEVRERLQRVLEKM